MKILAIGAHPDDIELYCGGYLMKAIDKGHEVRTIVCTNGEWQGVNNNRVEEQKRANKFMGIKKCYFFNLEDGKLTQSSELVDKIDRVIKEYKPKVVLSHTSEDFHQDHVAVAKSVRAANRNWDFWWLTYMSYDSRMPFNANLFINIDKYFERKLKLLEIFKSQLDRWYFSSDIILSRSIGTNVGKYVEKFKIELSFM